MRKIIYVLIVLTLLDLTILFAGLAQVALEGRTGHWSPFWRVQAEVVARILTK